MATMIQAIRMALHVGESRLGVTDIFGEDVGPPLGGVFTGTQGLETAWNTPLDERGIVGTAIGLALAGQKPVAEIQFCDYAFNTIDLLKLAGNTYWSSGGDWNVPMVLMTPVGAGIRGSIYHSHSFDAHGDPDPRLEDRDAVDAARRLRPDAQRDRRSEPGDVPDAQGAAAREGHAGRGHPGRARRRQAARRA